MYSGYLGGSGGDTGFLLVLSVVTWLACCDACLYM